MDIYAEPVEIVWKTVKEWHEELGFQRDNDTQGARNTMFAVVLLTYGRYDLPMYSRREGVLLILAFT